MSDIDQTGQDSTKQTNNSRNGPKTQRRHQKSHLKIVEELKAEAAPVPNILGGKPVKTTKPKAEAPPRETPISIPKPGEFSLDMFKSTLDPSMAGVETLLTALPHHKISEAKDWVRLHPRGILVGGIVFRARAD
jgi:hypothetical protein